MGRVTKVDEARDDDGKGRVTNVDEGVVIETVVLFKEDSVGEPVGDSLEELVGESVGELVGEYVGDCVGEYVGDCVGEYVGDCVGDCVGESVLMFDGELEGVLTVGCCVGELV